MRSRFDRSGGAGIGSIGWTEWSGAGGATLLLKNFAGGGWFVLACVMSRGAGWLVVFNVAFGIFRPDRKSVASMLSC